MPVDITAQPMSRRLAVYGAVLGPILWTGYLLGLGVANLPRPVGFYPASPLLWTLYIVPPSGVGMLVGWGYDRVHVTATIVPVIVALLPWTRPLPVATLFGLNHHLLFALVFGLLLAAVEYGARHPDLLGPHLTRRAIAIGLAFGVLHTVLAIWLRTVTFDLSWGLRSVFGLIIVAWMVLGALLVGGIPGWLLGRFSLVSPLFVVTGAFAWSALQTWEYVQALRASGAAMGVAFTTFTFYLLVWFVVLAVAVLAGGLEYRVRRGEFPRPEV